MVFTIMFSIDNTFYIPFYVKKQIIPFFSISKVNYSILFDIEGKFILYIQNVYCEIAKNIFKYIKKCLVSLKPLKTEAM